MKNIFTSTAMILAAFTMSANGQASEEFPVLEGPYMGQEPPGKIAEPFAPGIISTDAWELEAVFAPGMNEFYFVTDRGDYERPTIIGAPRKIGGVKFKLFGYVACG